MLPETTIHRTARLTLFLALSALMTSGCQKGPAGEQPPALSVTAADAEQPRTANQRLLGTWSGQFAIDSSASIEDFDAATVDICKSIRMRVSFHADGKLEMSAAMTLPDVGTQTNDTNGTWTILSESGDEVTIRSVGSNPEPEEVTITFLDDDTFEMTPPNELKDLGTLRFTRVGDVH